MVEFMNLLEKIKRASAKLDGIVIILTGEMKMSAGVAFHDASFETYSIGAAFPSEGPMVATIRFIPAGENETLLTASGEEFLCCGTTVTEGAE